MSKTIQIGWARGAITCGENWPKAHELLEGGVKPLPGRREKLTQSKGHK